MPTPSSAPAATLEDLAADLIAEHESLDALVAAMAPGGWDVPTPAQGWAVRDQISHLAFFDDAAVLALTDPDAFAEVAEAATTAMAEGDDPMAEHIERGRALSGEELLAWWRRARRDLLAAVRATPAGVRVPWFGPPMSPMSFVSARLMETWAHGQDVADALGVERAPTKRLVHVALLGVRARPFSFLVHGRTDPGGRVRVLLDAPDGGRWCWDTGHEPDAAGPDADHGAAEEADADAEVRGPAIDFCLVVTQRRNVADTALEVRGTLARQWMELSQAFAGPPGPGRPPLNR